MYIGVGPSIQFQALLTHLNLLIKILYVLATMSDRTARNRALESEKKITSIN